MQIEIISTVTAIIDNREYRWEPSLGLWVSRDSAVCYHEDFTIATGFRTTELRWRSHGDGYSSAHFVEMKLHDQGVNPCEVYAAYEGYSYRRGEYCKWTISGWRGFLPNREAIYEIWGSTQTEGDVILGLDNHNALRLRKLGKGRYVALGLLRGTRVI